MKIGLLVQRFPYGGAEKYVQEIATRLVQNGDDVTVVTSEQQDVDDSAYMFEIIRLPTVLSIGEYWFWRGLEDILKLKKFDIVHANTYGYYHTDKASRLKEKIGYKLVITSHGFHGTDLYDLKRQKIISKNSSFGFLRPLYDDKIGFKTLLLADHLIALSKRDVELYRKIGVRDEKISVIPPGIRDVFYQKEFDLSLRNKLNGDPLLLSVGELSWIKSQSIQIKALSQILKKKPSAKLFIVGRDRTELVNLKLLCAKLGIEKNVFFLGSIDDQTLYSYMHACDVLIHTSLAEGLSTVLLEAMACGLPFVTTPAGGNGYLSEETGAGVIVPFEDETKLAATIISLVDDKRNLKLLADNGKNMSLQFAWNRIFERIYKIYSNLTSSDSSLVDHS